MDRYMLRMDVEDPSGVTLFVAFDREAEYLIQKPVTELVDSYKKASPCNFTCHLGENGPQAVQTALEQVAGKEFIFQVKINYYSQNKENQSFVIYKIFPTTVDDDTIKKETIEKDKTNRSTDLDDGLIGVEVSSQAMESELPRAKKTKIM
ncbi:hypothetical protein IFM89_023842 [Coptis chinensis]|uniref:Replication factor A C-terminal domain-containing protein n=1 Tax=Coptis chinensis TaxID=261450 RepID=A0A835IWT4_9MAGN|nr:hypothetical protein IFM89_023842 [Coptis chinensis]